MYHDLLGFLPSRDGGDDDDDNRSWAQKVKYRVTNNVITSEVAGMVVNAMRGDSTTTTGSTPLLVQPDGVDSLEPSYTCAAAADLYDSSRSDADPAWAAHLEAARGLYAVLDGISGVDAADEGFHASLDHYYDNLSARQCHGKPLPCKLVNATSTSASTSASSPAAALVNDTGSCVTQAMADEAYRLGNWEYSHVYRGSGAGSLAASAGSFGVWTAELAAHLRGVVDGTNGGGTLWFHNVAHDGSVSRVLGILQVDVMVWPGMGSEVVFELWRRTGRGGDGEGAAASGGYYVRVLFGGKVLTSSNPSLGTLDMVPVETLLA